MKIYQLYNFIYNLSSLKKYTYFFKKIKKKSYRYKQNLPDLEEIFKQIFVRLKKSIIKNNKIYESNRYKKYILFGLIILLFTIFISGFYTIKEAERGVVLRFGKFNKLVQPGLNWKLVFIDTIDAINTESVRELAASGIMLTADENVVKVEMNVQYRITNPKNYLFNVTNPDDSLRQATDSALRGVIGKYAMDRILTEGRTLVRSDTQRVLEETIQPYNMGITLLDVNFQAARPPEEVKEAFDDAIAACENEQQYIREAEAYANEVQPKANGQAQRILEEGRSYKVRTLSEAQGEIQRFLKVLPEYKSSPSITRKRLYIESMERILKNNKKILFKEKNTSLIFIPFSSLLENFKDKEEKNKDTASLNILNIPKKSSYTSSNQEKKIKKIDIDNQRFSNTKRDNIFRKGRE